jgi:NADH-quinone oxidoreductase subunit M
MLSNNLLTLIVFIPAVGGVALMFFPKRSDRSVKWFALAISLVVLALSVVLWVRHAQMGYPGIDISGDVPVVPFQEKHAWIPALGISYHLGADGLSVPLIFLTALLTVVSIGYSFYIGTRVKEYFVLFLFLQTGMTGVFCALDYFLFYIFWEVSLVPMYFLIGVWGGPRREYAAIKFFLYTLVGSLAMLLAILACYFNVGNTLGERTFDVLAIMKAQPFTANFHLMSWAFWGFFLAFAIKVPMWPFHTWLPDAHVEAPTAGSIILAGVLLKLGTYGFIRFLLPTFPQAATYYSIPIGILAVIAIIYGALVAMAQWDFKKLIAYSSVNHMGYVMLGLATACAAAKGVLSPEVFSAKVMATQGAVMQMFNHGIITGGLFMLVGVIYERVHERDLHNFGGLGVVTPVYAWVFTTTMFASLGLPGMSGFIAEFYVFVGTFNVYWLLAALGVIGVIVTAAFFLWSIQRMFLGPLNERWKALKDLDWREKLSAAPLLIFMVWFGIWPATILNAITPSIEKMVGVFH